MKAKLRVHLNGSSGNFGLAELETDIHFAPTVGMEFYGLPWNDGKEVMSVSYVVEDELLQIGLAPDEFSDDLAKRYADTYRNRGWTLIGVIASKDFL